MNNELTKTYLPILCIIAVPSLTIVNSIIYMKNVDFNWLLDFLIETGKIKEQAREVLSRGLLGGYTVIFSSVVTILVVVFWCFYVAYICRNVKSEITPNTLFSYVCYSFFGTAVSSIITFVLLITHDEYHVSFYDLKVTSVNSLFVQENPGSKWFNFYSSIDVVSLLGFAILYLLFSENLEKGHMKYFALATLPEVVFYGGWALYLQVI